MKKVHINCIFKIVTGFYAFTLLACQPIEKSIDLVSYDLSDSTWHFSQAGENSWHEAKVPGSVHMDLLRNELIEDPYYRDNETRLQWIGEKDWTYTSQFTVGSELMNKNNVTLDFKGLDTYAKVFLNDSLILKADNFFRDYQVECKALLNQGENHLRIEFESPVRINKERKNNAKIPLPDDYVYCRKPAYHFGWDWGPVYITSGIWKPVLLKGWNETRIINMQVVQKELTTQTAALELVYEIEAEEALEVELTTECAAAKIHETEKVKLKPGINFIKSQITIQKPQLWWPTGLGDQYLYNITGKLITDNRIIGEVKERTGLREIKLVQKPDSLGKSFHFEVNGVPVFAKGANYIPQDMFLNRPDTADYEYILQQAVDANMNMLRVWAGGFYENDLFYDLCDEKGLLVWQDFMFACAMYPGDKDFLDNVSQEAIENVKRIRNHPCIALWCGNNENYIGWQDWRWSDRYTKEDSATVWKDYEALYHQLLPEIIKQYDTDRFYWPSSPLFGWGYPVNSEGDVHYWGIWHAQEPFEEFAKPQNIGRFMSEYGFQGCPEFKTVKAFTRPEDWDINSDVMKNHQKHRVGYPVIDKYIKWYYQWPKDFKSYLYVSQVLQAKGIGYAIEIHRRSMPHCMGTLYWQINDCWPVTSWASIDSYGRWKALHYMAKKVYNDLLISPVLEDGLLKVYVVSDRLEALDARLSLNLTTLDGIELWKKEINTSIDANSSKVYLKIPEAFFEDIDKNDVVLTASLFSGQKLESRNHFYFVQPKDLELEKPSIQINISEMNEKGEYTLQLTTDKLAKNLFLWLENEDGFFSDNYFDLLPGSEKTITYKPGAGAGNPQGKIQMTSLVDTY